MDLGVKIFSHEDSHRELLLLLRPEVDREHNVMILFIISRRGLDHNIRHFRLGNYFQRPAAGELLHAAHTVRTHHYQ